MKFLVQSMSRIINSVTMAAELLAQGKVVAIPTETVYGLAADCTNDKAVAGIYQAKGRPQFNPLICHVSGKEQAAKYVEVTNTASKLMDTFWPGPLTIVMKRLPNCEISLLCSAGLDTVGIRCPQHEVTRELITAFGRPIAAPSANRSGKVSPTSAEDVIEAMSPTDVTVLEGGRCTVGLESTIVWCARDDEVPRLLRPGGITLEQIAQVVGSCEIGFTPSASISSDATTSKQSAENEGNSANNKPFTSPGQMTSHYAPDCAVRLNASDTNSSEVLLAFGSSADVPQGAVAVLNLSSSGSLIEAAANLFSFIRQADKKAKELGVRTIAIMPIPDQGLGWAINDRLNRAAAPRPDSAPTETGPSL